jgi:branched-chain amino acid transport system ATP-binding protein
MSPLLVLNDVSFRYGALKVTNALSFDIKSGEALGVIGPNGAGKSTLLDLISGTKAPYEGSIWFAGQNITRASAQARTATGIARSFQIPRPFTGMTVFENLLVGATLGGTRAEKAAYAACVRILDLTRLSHRANEKASALRLLDRKRLELARALATGPKLLLLDEVAGGLSDMETGDLVTTIKDVHAAGTTVIWIEHVVHALMAVATRILVLDQGSKVVDGEPDKVMNSQQVRDIYLGMPA